MIRRDFIITTLSLRGQLGLWSLSGLMLIGLFSPILWTLVENVHLLHFVPKILGQTLQD